MTNVSIEQVTPQIALAYLNTTKTNRHLSVDRVAVLAETMILGDFKENGETIIFDDCGTLIDGQHRMAAIVKSNVTIKCIVVRGVCNTALDTIDIGRSRNAADIISISGSLGETSKALASAARLALIFELSKGNSITCPSVKTRAKITSDKIAKYAMENTVLQSAINDLMCYKKPGIIISVAVAGFILYRARNQSILADEYINAVMSGIGLHEKSPALTVRTKLLNSKSRQTPLSKAGIIGVVSSGWKYHRDGRKIPANVGNLFRNLTEKVSILW